MNQEMLKPQDSTISLKSSPGQFATELMAFCDSLFNKPPDAAQLKRRKSSLRRFTAYETIDRVAGDFAIPNMTFAGIQSFYNFKAVKGALQARRYPCSCKQCLLHEYAACDSQDTVGTFSNIKLAPPRKTSTQVPPAGQTPTQPQTSTTADSAVVPPGVGETAEEGADTAADVAVEEEDGAADEEDEEEEDRMEDEEDEDDGNVRLAILMGSLEVDCFCAYKDPRDENDFQLVRILSVDYALPVSINTRVTITRFAREDVTTSWRQVFQNGECIGTLGSILTPVTVAFQETGAVRPCTGRRAPHPPAHRGTRCRRRRRERRGARAKLAM
jgi:hypothetical protein